MVISAIMNLELQFKDLTSNLIHDKDDNQRIRFQCRIYTFMSIQGHGFKSKSVHRQER
jgi:hypothetical protein